MQIDIGIDEASRKNIADGLARVQADTYALYLKTFAVREDRPMKIHRLLVVVMVIITIFFKRMRGTYG